MSDIYARMYGNRREQEALDKKASPIDNKSAARQIGGLKAQGVTSMSVDVNGSIVEIPRMEYVSALEKQIRELKAEAREMKSNMIKLQNAINKIYGLIG